MTQQKTYVDYRRLGDTGADNTSSIQPYVNGEPALEIVLNRSPENLRARTETVRSVAQDLLYHRDAKQYTVELAASGVLNWGGTAALGGTGVFNNTTAMTLRPLLGVVTDVKGELVTGTAPSNQLSYTVAPTAYASDGLNAVTVEHRNVPGTVVPVCTVSAGPVKRIVVVFDAANPSHDAPTVQPIVAAAIGGDSVLNGRLTVSQVGAPGVVIETVAEIEISARTHPAGTAGRATADAEAHVIPANALGTLTTGRPLIEGDLIAVRYDYVVEPVGGDPDDPKGGVAGGRAESNVARGTATVTTNLFVAADNPEWLPGAIPVVKIVGNVAVMVSGQPIAVGVATPPNTAGGAASLVQYGGGGAWADGTTNPATTVEGQLDKNITDLAGAAGSAKIGGAAYTSTIRSNFALSAGTGQAQLRALLDRMAQEQRRDDAERVGLMTANAVVAPGAFGADPYELADMQYDAARGTYYAVGQYNGVDGFVISGPSPTYLTVLSYQGAASSLHTIDINPRTTAAGGPVVVAAGTGTGADSVVYRVLDASPTFANANIGATPAFGDTVQAVRYNAVFDCWIGVGGTGPNGFVIRATNVAAAWTAPITTGGGLLCLAVRRDNGHMAAGGEDGRLIYSTDGGLVWNTAAAAIAAGYIITAVSWDALRSQWVVVYASTGLVSGAANLVRRFAADFSSDVTPSFTRPAGMQGEFCNWLSADVDARGNFLGTATTLPSAIVLYPLLHSVDGHSSVEYTEPAGVGVVPSSLRRIRYMADGRFALPATATGNTRYWMLTSRLRDL